MMSDFIEHLINRHLGKGEQVLPRARARFEPDTAAAFLPQEAEEDPHNSISPTSAAKSPDNGWENTHDDWSSSKVMKLNKSFCGGPGGGFLEKSPLVVAEGIKQSVHDQRESVIEPVSSVRADSVDKNMNKVSRQELVQQQGKENPIHIVTIKTKESPGDQRTHQSQQATNELSLTTVQPMNLTEPEQVMAKSQPVFTGIPNTGMETEGLLDTPAWLSGKQGELLKGLFVNDSKAETEPVINVTVGRIEVRATRSLTPEQPRKQKKPSGVMSLDQYLNRRTQGEGGSP